MRQCLGDLDTDAHDRGGRESGDASKLVERSAIYQFHGDKVLALLLTDLVDGADVGMIEGGGATRLTQQTRTRAGLVHRLLGKHLERHLALQAIIARAIDLPHAARTQAAEDREVADPGARGERVTHLVLRDPS